MTHTLSVPTRSIRAPSRLDATRIGAETGTIAIHAALLLLLLAPMTPRIVEDASSDGMQVVPVHRVPPRVVPPPPAPLPVQTRPTRPSDAARTAPLPRPDDTRVAADVVAPAIGDVATDPVDDAPTAAGASLGIGDAPATASGASLQTLAAPPPPYPRDALRDRLEGTVVLDVHVDPSGRPIEVTVVSSSGHRVLDRAARRQVLQRWRFQPAMQDGRAVPALGRVPVAFVLER